MKKLLANILVTLCLLAGLVVWIILPWWGVLAAAMLLAAWL